MRHLKYIKTKLHSNFGEIIWWVKIIFKFNLKYAKKQNKFIKLIAIICYGS